MLLGITTGVPSDRALFEVMSAFSTSGLTTGLTAELSEGGQVVLSAMMFVGRVGTVAVASALARSATRCSASTRTNTWSSSGRTS